jgi:hypothetical protein
MPVTLNPVTGEPEFTPEGPPAYHLRTLRTTCPDGVTIETIWPPSWRWGAKTQEAHADLHRDVVRKHLYAARLLDRAA